jgi:hypothetical protein
MSYGSGYGPMGVGNKSESGGGAAPPFALNSADNGLSVDPTSFHIVLGNNPIGIAGGAAELTSSREIDLNGNFLQFFDSGQPTPAFMQFLGNVFQLLQNGGQQFVSISPTEIDVTDNTTGATTHVTPGDVTTFDGGFLQSNLSFSELDFANGSAGTTGLIGLDAITGNMQLKSSDYAGGAFLVVDHTNHAVTLGDFNNIFNGSIVRITPAGSGFFSVETAAKQVITADIGNIKLELGDVNSVGNNSRIEIDDSNHLIRLNATHVNLGAIQVFATNALAVAGGLNTNDLYRNAAGVVSAVL